MGYWNNFKLSKCLIYRRRGRFLNIDSVRKGLTITKKTYLWARITLYIGGGLDPQMPNGIPVATYIMNIELTTVTYKMIILRCLNFSTVSVWWLKTKGSWVLRAASLLIKIEGIGNQISIFYSPVKSWRIAWPIEHVITRFHQSWVHSLSWAIYLNWRGKKLKWTFWQKIYIKGLTISHKNDHDYSIMR